MVGITAVYQQVQDLTPSVGSFITEEDERSGSLVIVLGATVAKDLFGSGQAVGQNVRVGTQTMRVVGVLATKGSGGFGSADDQAFISLSTAQRRLFDARVPTGSRISSIGISVIRTEDIAAVKSRLALLLRERHNLANDGSADDFNVLDQSSILGTLTTITSLLTLFLGAVAAISLLIGGIGIMNIMLVSVTERTREIGLRKAVGARRGDILLQFVAESLALSLAGGVIGLVLGSIIPLAVTALGLLDAPVSLSSAAIALSFSLAVGLFFGIYPARRAAALNPIEALRSE